MQAYQALLEYLGEDEMLKPEIEEFAKAIVALEISVRKKGHRK